MPMLADSVASDDSVMASSLLSILKPRREIAPSRAVGGERAWLKPLDELVAVAESTLMSVWTLVVGASTDASRREEVIAK